MNYEIYELKLKPQSPWITDLTADTIFGHLCWQIKYEFWKETLEKFLEEMSDKPIFTISDVLPLEEIFKPLFDEDNISNLIVENFEKIKHYKKLDYVNLNTIKETSSLNWVDNWNISEIRNYVLWNNYIINKYDFWYKKSDYKNEIINNKNNINRNTWTTWDNWIYSESSKITTREFRLLLKNISWKDLENYDILWKKLNFFDLLKSIFSDWYWKKKNTWKWFFKVFDFVEKKFDFENFNYLLVLSNFIPSEKDSTEWNYKIFTKFPKMWEEFSSEWQNFYKKPMIMLESWATFKKSENYDWYVWRMIKNVAIWKENIYHYAYWFTLEF